MMRQMRRRNKKGGPCWAFRLRSSPGINCALFNPPETIESARAADCVYNSSSDMPILTIGEYTVQARSLAPAFGFAAQTASRLAVKFQEERA
jgi:hypothetical protein